MAMRMELKGPSLKKGNLKAQSALAGVAQWPQPVNQRVAGSIPSQNTCLGCRPGKRQLRTDVSVPLFLPPFSSLFIFFTKNK